MLINTKFFKPEAVQLTVSLPVQPNDFNADEICITENVTISSSRQSYLLSLSK